MKTKSQKMFYKHIDCFTIELKNIAINDKVEINTFYNPNTEILEILSCYYEIKVISTVKSKQIVANILNLNRFAHFVYNHIKNELIEYCEYIENKQKEESEVDEKWEFVELGYM